MIPIIILKLLYRLHKQRLSAISFNITNRCNSRCLMCSVWKQKEEELGIEDLSKIFKDLRKNGIYLVEITGGEPLLRNDLFDFTSLLDNLGMVYTLNTNGFLLNENAIRKLNECRNLLQIAISLDTLDKERFKLLRGIDALDTVKSNLLLAKRLLRGKTVKCSMTISRENYQEWESVYSWVKDNGFVFSIFPVNNGVEFYHRSSNSMFAYKRDKVDEEIVSIFQKIAEKRRRGEPFWEFSYFYDGCEDYIFGKPLKACGAARLFLDLHSDGSLAVCNDLKSGVNLLSTRFGDAVNELERYRNNIITCYTNTPCYYTCSYNISYIAEKPIRYLIETLKVMGLKGIVKRLWT